MARTRVGSEMLAEARQRADMEDSELCSDDEIYRYLSQSAARIYGKVASLDETDFVVGTNITLTPGSESYPIGATFWRLASIPPTVNYGGGRYGSLHRWNPGDRAALLDTEGSSWAYGSGSRLYYRLGPTDTIMFLPVPDQALVVTVYYLPASPTIGDDTIYDGRNGWEEWVVIDAAIKMLMKEESDVRALIAERDALWEEIKPQAAAKDLAEPDRVRDVDGGWGWR